MAAAGITALRFELIHFFGQAFVKGPFGFARFFPSKGADNILLDFTGALVNASNFDIPFNFFNAIFDDISVSAQGLHGIISSFIGGFGGKKLGNGTLDFKVLLPGIQSCGHFINIICGRCQPDGMGYNQFMGVALFFRQRCFKLDPFFGIGNDDIQGRFTAAKRHRSHHQPGIPEYFAGLFKALSGYAANNVFHRHENIGKGQRRGI